MDIKTKVYIKKIYLTIIWWQYVETITLLLTNLTLNKPAYVAMCISEFSKVLMYKFHYDYIKNKYGNNSRLLFTDTDSLMFNYLT